MVEETLTLFKVQGLELVKSNHHYHFNNPFSEGLDLTSILKPLAADKKQVILLRSITDRLSRTDSGQGTWQMIGSASLLQSAQDMRMKSQGT